MHSSDIVIFGLGVTGLTVARHLSKKNLPFIMVDNRKAPPKLSDFQNEFPSLPIHLGDFPKDLLSRAKTLILSPGLSKQDPLIQQSISKETEIIGDIELFARDLQTPVVAITGSNGKSTVTTLVGEMALKAGIRTGVGGNLGTAALSILDDSHELYVLELSSFQLETTYSLKPTVATILNLCPDHMDRYATLEEYHDAKKRIYQNASHIVVNRDDLFVSEGVPKNISCTSFGLNPPTKDYEFGLLKDKETWFAKGSTRILPVTELKLFGRHNVANALSALAIGDSLSLPMEAMISVLQTFKGLPHRCEWVRTLNEVEWINDSKGTNVGATLAALQGLSEDIPGKWVLIAGGLGKNADFTPLKEPIQKYCRAVILIGEAADELQILLKDRVPTLRAKTMADAVAIAAKQAKPKDGVLLSPACASYDMFQHFEHRGNVFKEAVLAL